jgi:hypothetical protein
LAFLSHLAGRCSGPPKLLHLQSLAGGDVESERKVNDSAPAVDLESSVNIVTVSPETSMKLRRPIGAGTHDLVSRQQVLLKESDIFFTVHPD